MYGSTHVQVDSVLTTVPMKMPTMPNGLASRIDTARLIADSKSGLCRSYQYSPMASRKVSTLWRIPVT